MCPDRHDFTDDSTPYGKGAARNEDREFERDDPYTQRNLKRLWWAAGISWLVAICVVYLTFCHKPPEEPSTNAGRPATPATVAQSGPGQSGAVSGGQSVGDGPMSHGYRVGPDGKLLQPDQGNLTPPELPEEAKQETPEGAQAYAEHYIALLTYAFKTGQTQELKDSYNAECESCIKRTTRIETIYSGGGWADGEGYIVEDMQPAIQVTEEDKLANRWHVRLSTTTPGHTLFQHDNIEQVEEKSTEVAIAVCWQNEGWTVCGTNSRRIER